MLKIDDFNEISELHKAILAAKFATFPDPQYSGITSSPILAGLSNRIYDELGKHKANKIIGADAYEELRRVKTSQGFRGQWRIAVMAARRDRFFMSQSREDRKIQVKCYLSPFTCTDNELEAFLDEVEKSGDKKIEKLFKEHDFSGAPLYGCSYDYSAGGDARLVLGMKRGVSCDIFFSGVHTFRVSADGEIDPEDTLPLLKKHTVSSGSLQKIEADFESEKRKEHIVIEAETVDYWL